MMCSMSANKGVLWARESWTYVNCVLMVEHRVTVSRGEVEMVADGTVYHYFSRRRLVVFVQH